MAKRFFQVYVHLIWRTKYNRPLLKGDLEAFVHERMREIGEELRLDALAVNSAWNHTHSLFGWHPSVCIADVVREMKSRVGNEWNSDLDAGLSQGPRLVWQMGYGAVSIRRAEIPAIVRYIDQQKIHHSRKSLREVLERVTEVETTSSKSPILLRRDDGGR